MRSDSASLESQERRWRRINSVHGKLVTSVILRGAGALCALGVNVILARSLGAAEYGRYTVVMAVALTLASLGAGGADRVLTRELARNEPTEDGRLKRWLFKYVTRSTALAIALYFVWTLFIVPAHPSGVTQIWYAIPAVALIATATLCTVEAGALNGFAASLKSQALVLVVKNAGVLGVLAAIGIGGYALRQSLAALWIQLAGYTMALFVGVRWLRKLAPASVDFRDVNKGVGERNVAIDYAWSAASRSFFLTVLASILVARIDVLLVSRMGGDAVAGIYAAGARLAAAAQMVGLATITVLSPRFAVAWKSGVYDVVRKLLWSGFAAVIPAAIVEVVIAYWFAPMLPLLLGADYRNAAAPFLWVTIGYALWTVAAPGYALLMMIGSEKIVAGLSWLVLVLNVTGIIVLVPFKGAAGASMAMTLGYLAAVPILFAAVVVKLRPKRQGSSLATK